LDINVKFTDKQLIAWEYLHDDKTSEILYGGSAGGGKTFLGCAWIIINCLKYKNTRWLIGRSKLDSLKKTTLKSFFDVCKSWNIKSGVDYTLNSHSNIITFFNGSEIILKDLFLYPSDPEFDSLGSLEITGAFIDEASQIELKAKNTVASRIRYKLDEYGLTPKILMTCNPSRGWIYTEFYKKWKDEKLEPHRQFIQALITDNPYIPKSYINQLQQSLDRVQKQRLLYGMWEFESDASTLIDYDNIVALWNNNHVFGYSIKKYISADIARFGQDKTTITLWTGLVLEKVYILEKKSVVQSANFIRELAREHRVQLSNIVIDADGVGGGAADMLLGCYNFMGNRTPIQTGSDKANYQNLKSQCYYKLAEIINEGQILIKDESPELKKNLVEELEQVKKKNWDKDGKLQIMSKDEVKSIIGRSPDFSDALMMRMVFELKNTEFSFDFSFL
jgi:phage terminase large subunit